MASPIGWIVVAIGALVAAIVIAWKKFEGFRKVVMGVWEVIKQLGIAIWNIIKALYYLATGQIGKAAQSMKEGVDKITNITDAYKRGIQKQIDKKKINIEAKQKTEKIISQKEVKQTVNNTTLKNTKIDVAPGISEVSSAAPKVFNLNINKMVEKIDIITNTIVDSKTDIKKYISETLIEAINDANMVLG